MARSRSSKAKSNLKKSIYFGGSMGVIATAVGLAVSIPVYNDVNAELDESFVKLKDLSGFMNTLAVKVGLTKEDNLTQELDSGYAIVYKDYEAAVYKKSGTVNTLVINMKKDGSVDANIALEGPAALEMIGAIDDASRIMDADGKRLNAFLNPFSKDNKDKSIEAESKLLGASKEQIIERNTLSVIDVNKMTDKQKEDLIASAAIGTGLSPAELAKIRDNARILLERKIDLVAKEYAAAGNPTLQNKIKQEQIDNQKEINLQVDRAHDKIINSSYNSAVHFLLTPKVAMQLAVKGKKIISHSSDEKIMKKMIDLASEQRRQIADDHIKGLEAAKKASIDPTDLLLLRKIAKNVGSWTSVFVKSLGYEDPSKNISRPSSKELQVNLQGQLHSLGLHTEIFNKFKNQIVKDADIDPATNMARNQIVFTKEYDTLIESDIDISRLFTMKETVTRPDGTILERHLVGRMWKRNYSQFRSLEFTSGKQTKSVGKIIELLQKRVVPGMKRDLVLALIKFSKGVHTINFNATFDFTNAILDFLKYTLGSSAKSDFAEKSIRAEIIEGIKQIPGFESLHKHIPGTTIANAFAILDKLGFEVDTKKPPLYATNAKMQASYVHFVSQSKATDREVILAFVESLQNPIDDSTKRIMDSGIIQGIITDVLNGGNATVHSASTKHRLDKLKVIQKMENWFVKNGLAPKIDLMSIMKETNSEVKINNMITFFNTIFDNANKSLFPNFIKSKLANTVIEDIFNNHQKISINNVAKRTELKTLITKIESLQKFSKKKYLSFKLDFGRIINNKSLWNRMDVPLSVITDIVSNESKFTHLTKDGVFAGIIQGIINGSSTSASFHSHKLLDKAVVYNTVVGYETEVNPTDRVSGKIDFDFSSPSIFEKSEPIQPQLVKSLDQVAEMVQGLEDNDRTIEPEITRFNKLLSAHLYDGTVPSDFSIVKDYLKLLLKKEIANHAKGSAYGKVEDKWSAFQTVEYVTDLYFGKELKPAVQGTHSPVTNAMALEVGAELGKTTKDAIHALWVKGAAQNVELIKAKKLAIVSLNNIVRDEVVAPTLGVKKDLALLAKVTAALSDALNANNEVLTKPREVHKVENRQAKIIRAAIKKLNDDTNKKVEVVRIANAYRARQLALGLKKKVHDAIVKLTPDLTKLHKPHSDVSPSLTYRKAITTEIAHMTKVFTDAKSVAFVAAKIPLYEGLIQSALDTYNNDIDAKNHASEVALDLKNKVASAIRDASPVLSSLHVANAGVIASKSYRKAITTETDNMIKAYRSSIDVADLNSKISLFKGLIVTAVNTYNNDIDSKNGLARVAGALKAAIAAGISNLTPDLSTLHTPIRGVTASAVYRKNINTEIAHMNSALKNANSILDVNNYITLYTGLITTAINTYNTDIDTKNTNLQTSRALRTAISAAIGNTTPNLISLNQIVAPAVADTSLRTAIDTAIKTMKHTFDKASSIADLNSKIPAQSGLIATAISNYNNDITSRNSASAASQALSTKVHSTIGLLMPNLSTLHTLRTFPQTITAPVADLALRKNIDNAIKDMKTSLGSASMANLGARTNAADLKIRGAISAYNTDIDTKNLKAAAQVALNIKIEVAIPKLTPDLSAELHLITPQPTLKVAPVADASLRTAINTAIATMERELRHSTSPADLISRTSTQQGLINTAISNYNSDITARDATAAAKVAFNAEIEKAIKSISVDYSILRKIKPQPLLKVQPWPASNLRHAIEVAESNMRRNLSRATSSADLSTRRSTQSSIIGQRIATYNTDVDGRNSKAAAQVAFNAKIAAAINDIKVVWTGLHTINTLPSPNINPTPSPKLRQAIVDAENTMKTKLGKATTDTELATRKNAQQLLILSAVGNYNNDIDAKNTASQLSASLRTDISTAISSLVPNLITGLHTINAVTPPTPTPTPNTSLRTAIDTAITNMKAALNAVQLHANLAGVKTAQQGLINTAITNYNDDIDAKNVSAEKASAVYTALESINSVQINARTNNLNPKLGAESQSLFDAIISAKKTAKKNVNDASTPQLARDAGTNGRLAVLAALGALEADNLYRNAVAELQARAVSYHPILGNTYKVSPYQKGELAKALATALAELAKAKKTGDTGSVLKTQLALIDGHIQILNNRADAYNAMMKKPPATAAVVQPGVNPASEAQVLPVLAAVVSGVHPTPFVGPYGAEANKLISHAKQEFNKSKWGLSSTPSISDIDSTRFHSHDTKLKALKTWYVQKSLVVLLKRINNKTHVRQGFDAAATAAARKVLLAYNDQIVKNTNEFDAAQTGKQLVAWSVKLTSSMNALFTDLENCLQ